MISVLVSFILLFLGNSYLTPAFVAGLFGARCSRGGLLALPRETPLAIGGIKKSGEKSAGPGA